LYIETPDASNYHEFPNVPFYYLDSEHINHFDLARLTLLLQSRGYNIEVFIQKAIEVSENSLYPAISVMGRKSEIAAEVKDEVNQLSEDIIISIIQHIKQSTHLQHFNIIDSLADSQEQLVVFGVGSYTSRLLGSSRLNECNIVAFIDNDTVKQGTTVMGIHVYSPEYLRKNDCSVLVCSALHADKMVKQIADMNIKRNIYFPILEGI
jgi:hypothetical protein